jgi:hypothetical protein
MVHIQEPVPAVVQPTVVQAVFCVPGLSTANPAAVVESPAAGQPSSVTAPALPPPARISTETSGGAKRSKQQRCSSGDEFLSGRATQLWFNDSFLADSYI